MIKIKNILLSCVFIFGSLSLSGCYTQLSMFYPEPENDDSELYYETYSRAVPRPVNVSIYAQTGAGTPLGLAYQMMYNRFNGMYNYFGNYGSGYYNRYDYYNRYGYHTGYNGYDTYLLGGYTMYIPVKTGERKQRTFSTSRDDNSPGTNLNVTRTRSTQSNSSNNNTYTNSSNVSSNRGSSGGSSSSSSSSSSGGRRATRRN